MRPNYWNKILPTKWFKDAYRHITINIWDRIYLIFTIYTKLLLENYRSGSENGYTGGKGCPLAQLVPSHSPGAPLGGILMTP